MRRAGREPRPGGSSVRTAAIGLLTVVAAVLLATVASPGRAAISDGRSGPNSLDGQVVRDVRIVGNDSIPAETIRAKIVSRADRPFNRESVDKDIQRLNDMKLFSTVEYDVAKTPDGQGLVLTFRVVEMPILRDVQYIGRKAIWAKTIEASTQLKKGSRADWVRARQAVEQIRQIYEDKGYEQAEVRLVKGGDPADRELIFNIFEGPRSEVGSTDFVGNRFATDAMLMTKLAARKPLLGLWFLGGKYEKDIFEEDATRLADYYQSNGYLLVKIKPVIRNGDDIGTRNVTYVIDEGPRFRVRDVIIEGNQLFKTEALKADMKLHSGAYFNDAVQKADLENLKAKYLARGHIKIRVDVVPKFTTEAGETDLVYEIEEGFEFILGELIVRGNTRTQDRVIRREADMSGLIPGQMLDRSRMDKFTQRINNLNLFQTSPQAGGKPVEVRITHERPANTPFSSEGPLPGLSEDLGRTRMQDPDDPPRVAPLDEPPRIEVAPPTAVPGGGEAPTAPFGMGGRPFSPPVDTLPPDGVGVPVPAPSTAPSLGRPLFGGRPYRTGGATGIEPPQSSGPAGSIFDRTNPTGGSPGFLNNNINNTIGPDRQEPFTSNKAYADVLAIVDEAPTAKFQLGFGASSFGGLFGSLTLTENNFNLFAIPRSLDDIIQGRAFRGAGQQFSIQLQPGTLINSYSVSFRDPYLFENFPIGFQAEGYQWNRYYYDWREQRSGGRFALGGQIGTKDYAEVGFRIEDVSISNFRYPAPALLLDAAGHTTLATVRPSYRIDTRDSPFLPTSGGYYETAFEQGYGTYTFSKITAEGRKYFTLAERPDGSGKQVLTLRGFLGVTGRDTPIYERFFAGNLNSIRGFQFRGVGPFVMTVNTGGVLESLFSAEYRVPLTANDHIQQVFFVDTGTVENDYRFTTYRVSVGTGLRVIIPQIFKQVPLAFDLGFPVSRAPLDRVMPFSFSMGAQF